MDTHVEAHAIEPDEITAPLSLRLAQARVQLSALFTAGELAPLGFRAAAALRALEVCLHDAAGESFALECDLALLRARRRPWWRRPGRRLTWSNF